MYQSITYINKAGLLLFPECLSGRQVSLSPEGGNSVCALQSKMEKLYTVSKNKAGS